MGWAKSLFVSGYMMAAMAIGAVAVVELTGGSRDLTWAGAALTSLPFLALLMWLMAFKPTARTSSRLPIITGLAVTGMGVAGYGYVAEDGSVAGVLATAVAFGGYLAYDFWYSTLDRPDAPDLAVGKSLPEFRLENASGTEVRSTSFRGRPTLLMFYRGNWCPLCMAQIREIAAQYRELVERGVRVAMVSPQPHDNTEKLAKKFDVPFEFLVDVDNRAARALGIEVKGGIPAGMQMFGYDSDTVLPTVIITDAKGTILFSDQTDNYRVRPEPATFLRVLDGASG
jgi:peroxiredoxin